MLRRNLRECSGPWSGFWILELVRGAMRLRLQFVESAIEGGGDDSTGDFTVAGMIADDNERVLFTKSYATHTVDYMGVWDGTMIYGRWTLHDALYTETGEFEIWPDRGFEGLLSVAGALEQTAV